MNLVPPFRDSRTGTTAERDRLDLYGGQKFGATHQEQLNGLQLAERDRLGFLREVKILMLDLYQR